MALLDELYEDAQTGKQATLEKLHRSEIVTVQNMLREYRVQRYSIVNVGFGAPLIKDEFGTYHELDKSFTIAEMKTLKGLNYGSHEFAFRHDAVILENIHLKYVHKITTLLVAPISSTRRKNSILLEKRFYPFLEKDSYILLGNLANIGIEKIYTKDTKRRLSKPGQKSLYGLRTPAQIKLKQTLKKLLTL